MANICVTVEQYHKLKQFVFYKQIFSNKWWFFVLVLCLITIGGVTKQKIWRLNVE